VNASALKVNGMHVAINGWFWDMPNAGSGQYLRHLLPYLRKVDPTLQISLIMPPHVPQPDAIPDGVTVVTTGNRSRTGKVGKVWFEQRTFPQTVARIGADLAHVPYWGAPLSSPVPLVVSVLDVIPLMYPVYAQGFFNRLYLSLVIQGAKAADHIITISHTSKLDIENYLEIPFDDITVTYLAPDQRFHPRMGADQDEAVREKYNLPPRFVLGGFGFDARKQVNELLLAYTYVTPTEGADVPLVLAGKQPDWSQPVFPDLPTYVDRLALNDHVQWIGYVDEADKASLYRLAEMFVFPSEYEGFGLPPLEAMACGTPVVAWDSVVADEILEWGAYLADSPRAMAGAIIGLLIQQPLRDALINQGLAQATKYNWRKTATETIEAYRRTVS
jgi:glycosyltransferase involved in cell wall biosynthesis